MAIPTDSVYSRIEGRNRPSTNQDKGIRMCKELENTRKKVPMVLTPWPSHKRSSNNSFEVFNSLLIGIMEAIKRNSETSSTSIQFKRKNAKKNVVPSHRPVTRSQIDSSNE